MTLELLLEIIKERIKYHGRLHGDGVSTQARLTLEYVLKEYKKRKPKKFCAICRKVNCEKHYDTSWNMAETGQKK